MTPDEQVSFAAGILDILDHWANDRRELTVQTVSHWVSSRGAGLPDVPLMEEQARGNAAIWAASATPVELEAYLAAALMELERNIVVSSKASKRLGALAFRAMQPDDRVKFREWMEGQKNVGAK